MRCFLLSLLLISQVVSYEYQIVVALVFQNEAKHLEEWIEYHRLVGVDHFYLYNNLSIDHYQEVLAPYIASGIVELFQIHQRCEDQATFNGIQTGCYMDALKRAKGKAKWFSCIDGDEYLVPLEKETLNEALLPYEQFAGVYLSWLKFGTSHHDKIPQDKLRIEAMVWCEGKPASLGKTIARTDLVKSIDDPHVFRYIPCFFHVNTELIRFWQVSVPSAQKMMVFHYYTGDLDHLINIKYPRRAKWIPGLKLDAYIQEQESLNKVYEPFMQKFVKKLKERGC